MNRNALVKIKFLLWWILISPVKHARFYEYCRYGQGEGDGIQRLASFLDERLPSKSDPSSGKQFSWVCILEMPLHSKRMVRLKSLWLFMIHKPIRWKLGFGFNHLRHMFMRNKIFCHTLYSKMKSKA